MAGPDAVGQAAGYRLSRLAETQRPVLTQFILNPTGR